MSLAISAAHGEPCWVTKYYQLLLSMGVPGILASDHHQLTIRPTCLHATRLCWILRLLAKRGPWLSGEGGAELRRRSKSDESTSWKP